MCELVESDLVELNNLVVECEIAAENKKNNINNDIEKNKESE